MINYRGDTTGGLKAGRNAYRIYQTVKLHFTDPRFDMFKTPSVKGISLEAYMGRADHKLFDLWARDIPDRQEWGMLLVANFAYGNPDVIHGNHRDARDIESKWRSRQASLGYVIDEDCNHLQQTPLRDLITFESGNVPKIMSEYIGSDITLETLVALNNKLNLVLTWSNNGSIIAKMLQPEFLRITRAAPFINYNTPKINSRLDAFVNHYGEPSS